MPRLSTVDIDIMINAINRKCGHTVTYRRIIDQYVVSSHFEAGRSNYYYDTLREVKAFLDGILSHVEFYRLKRGVRA